MKGRMTVPTRINVEELEKAEMEILKIVQADSFHAEITALNAINGRSPKIGRVLARRKKEEIKKTSSLYRLDPFLGSNGILRVGGRLRRSDEMATETKHPLSYQRKDT